jgi:acetyl/propionyl-CoA carboxylase alpha subunit
MSGRIADWHVPEVPGLRVDAGVHTGSEVSIHYDPMLAKVITHAPSRAEAIERMTAALSHLAVQGIPTNAPFLVDLLQHPAFAAGDLHTHFIDEHLREVLSRRVDPRVLRDAAVAATLAAALRRQATRTQLPALRSDWRNNPWRNPTTTWAHAEEDLEVSCAHLAGDRWQVRAPGDSEPHEVRVTRFADPELAYEEDFVVRRFRVATTADRTFVHIPSAARSIALIERPRFPERSADAITGGCTAPMPGKVVKVAVEPGQHVAAGTLLLVLEAMKMEHSIHAPYAGTVERILVSTGDQVPGDALLVIVAAAT